MSTRRMFKPEYHTLPCFHKNSSWQEHGASPRQRTGGRNGRHRAHGTALTDIAVLGRGYAPSWGLQREVEDRLPRPMHGEGPHPAVSAAGFSRASGRIPVTGKERNESDEADPLACRRRASA